MLPSPPSPDQLRALGDHLCDSPYLLEHDTVLRFWQEGVLGPLPCHAPELDTLLEDLHDLSPAEQVGGPKNVYDPQLEMETITTLARHPSIVETVAQLLGTGELSFFQARFRVKAPGRHDPQPWHQDVGKNHGGLQDDGTPIPSLTVWLSLDGAEAESGGVVLLPGTHQHLLGDWRAGFHGLKDLQTSLDTSQARVLATPKGHFHVFHSWAVHCSLTNRSSRPRSALILRYMDSCNAVNASFPHYPCCVQSLNP